MEREDVKLLKKKPRTFNFIFSYLELKIMTFKEINVEVIDATFSKILDNVFNI